MSNEMQPQARDHNGTGLVRRVEASCSEGRPDFAGFKLIHASDLHVTYPRWCVGGLVELNTVGMVFGAPGSGKSFYALGMACSVATGLPFHGRPVSQGPAVYIASEGHAGIARRRKAWELHHGLDLASAPLFVSEGDVALSLEESRKEIEQAVDEVAREHGAPRLIVIDTVARAYGPADENSTKDMNDFVKTVGGIGSKYGAAVLLVHHNGHSNRTRARGSMSLHGALDFEFRIDRNQEALLRVECTKMKDWERPDPMSLRLETVDLRLTDAAGDPVRSATLVPTICEAPEQRSRGQRLGKWQQVAMDEYEALAAQCERVTHRAWQRACRDAGMSRQRFHEVSRALASKGLVSLQSDQDD